MTEAGVALVTGAAKRIGRVIALELAAHGWDVGVHYNSSKADAQETVAGVERHGRRAALLAADLADEAQLESLIERANAALGPITLLVNNAGIFEFDRPETASRSSWDRHMAINLRAPLVLTQALLRQLPQDAKAVVVNLVDQRVWNLTPNYTSYSVSKVGLWGLTRHLATALAPRVRVNAIGPGLVLPGPGMDAEQFDAMRRTMPLGHGSSPEEIARAVRFILESPGLTGQMIALDGGRHLGWLLPGQNPDGR